MIPSRRTVRFFLIYGVVLFLADRLLIGTNRSAMESFALVLVADVLAIVAYTLLIKLAETIGTGKKN